MNMAARVPHGVPAHTPGCQERWEMFYDQQMGFRDNICPEHLEGLRLLNISRNGIPSFDRINGVLLPSRGWRVVAAPDNFTGKRFTKDLAQRRFRMASSIRSAEHMRFAPRPDFLHDVCHVPMLMNLEFADFMHAFGRAGVKAKDEEQIHQLLQLYFCTAETGLIRAPHTPSGFAIYGAACISSRDEAERCLSPDVERVPLDIEAIKKMNIDDTKLQERYFFVESFSDLSEALRKFVQ